MSEVKHIRSDDPALPGRQHPESPRATGRARLGRDFAWLWLAQGSSSVGAQIGELAMPLLAVLVLDATAGEVGLIGVARWLPFLLLALPLGVLVDRRRRRPLMIAADWARAAGTVALVTLAFSGLLTLPSMIALVLALGAFTVLFEVSYQSFLPTVVSRPSLAIANGRLQATASASEVGGPGIGGLLVQTLGAPWAVLSHAAAYVLSAVSLARIRTPEIAPTESGRRFGTELREGLRFVFSDRYLVSLIGFSGIYNLFAQWIFVLFTVHAVRVWGLSPAEIGAVFSLGAIGALVAAGLAPASVRALGAGRVFVGCAAAECLALAALPFIDASWPRLAMLATLTGVFAVNGAGTALSSVVALTLRQLRTPDRILGRVNATLRWLSYGVIAIGAGLGGFAGELVGTRAGIAIGCAGVALTVVWVVASPLRSVGDPQELATHDDGVRA